ncbi:membrane protein insertase YidC [Sulfurospirillum barnesii]|uniref:Membrane protein insertase YidC n=1 Tax=Sulfurospirillum barnesii (strain ATCC 700032 / DSM 10660 / SES-3) TaxID=760154 RepID=I3XXR9_SULBS|nr:membrane protein insertase YidC [Sulfurospirillum barnesii]AFL68743.1 protein translocase subunit yidC [Sulfurospirillum barnesii SES-3]
MTDKLTPQMRVIIATVLSFLFFALYDHFFIPKNTPLAETNTSKIEQNISSPSTALDVSSAVSSNDISQATVASGSEHEIIATIKAPDYEVKIDRLGRIAKFYLGESKYQDDHGDRIQLIDGSQGVLPLEIRFSDKKVNADAFVMSYTSDKPNVDVTENGSALVLTQHLADVTLTKTITFFPSGKYDLHVKLSNAKDYFISPGFRPNAAVDSYTFHGALIKKADSTIHTISDGDAKGDERFANARLIAAADKYYTTFFYELNSGLETVILPGKNSDPLLFAKGQDDFKLSGYIGPKEHRKLKTIEPELTDVVEYGFFTFIAKPLFSLLSYLHGIFGNWGWAIVAMTIIVRLVLYPLTYKGMVSMNKLKELAPKVKELQKKYGDDKQKLNMHMMELYKKHGANPMGGCLPILLQIPVFFAVYRVLQNAIELKGAEWILWVHDLAVMDPYFILPVLMGLTMFFHQKITPTTFNDPMQEKIMKFLPLIFTFFFVTFPAGLTLYWFTNNLASIVQQFYVNKLFAKKHKEEKAQ